MFNNINANLNRQKGLSGKLLIANPYTQFNDMFNKAVIYVGKHDETGAMGLIINQHINDLSYEQLFKMLRSSSEVKTQVPVYIGGPVEIDRGFILHSNDYKQNALINFDNNELCISSNLQILQDMALGEGPERSKFVMGYTGWNPGQLEEELANNHWIISDYYDDLVFDSEDEKKWQVALHRCGIDDGSLSSVVGRA